MDESKRGKIRSRKYATRIRDFSGLRFGTITPTDIDCLIEYKNRAFVIIELKFSGSQKPFGQRLALERLCDSLCKPCLLVFAEHSNTNIEDEIDAATTRVVEYRYNGKWHRPEIDTDTLELVRWFLSTVG